MMKFIAYSIFAFIGLLFLLPCIIQISDSTGIGKKEGGFKVYDVYSPYIDGRQFIAKYNIKCIAEDVETIDFVDIKRGKTFFAYNVGHHNYYFFEHIKYNQLAVDVVKKYRLSPQFSWLDKNGHIIYDYTTWILISIGAIFISIIYWPGRKNATASLKSIFSLANIKDIVQVLWEGIRDWLKNLKDIDYWLKD